MEYFKVLPQREPSKTVLYAKIQMERNVFLNISVISYKGVMPPDGCQID